MSIKGNCQIKHCDTAPTRLEPIHASVQDLKNGKWCTGPGNGHPGVISSVRMSKTGKHGHAKFTFNLKYPFTGQASQEMWPGHTHLTRPIVRKDEVQLTDIDGDEIICMDDDGAMVHLTYKEDFVDEQNGFGGKNLRELFELQQKENDFDIIISYIEGPIKDKKKDYFIHQVTGYKKKDDSEE